MDFLDFDPTQKDKWADLQARNSKNIIAGLKLKEGFCCAFARKGSEAYEKIKALLNKPTDTQRGYYWSVVIPTIRKAAEEKGQFYKNDNELHLDIKQIMLEDFGLYVEKTSKITNSIYREPISVSDAKGDRDNTRRYLEAVIYWAESYFGIEIPTPNNNFNNKESKK